MNHLRISHQNANSSPQPPPRNRQNLHHKMPGQSPSSAASSQLNVNHPSKSKTTVVISGQTHLPCIQNSSYTFPNSRNKIIFKDIHTAYGRPILRDRNEWRYKKRDTEGMKVNTPVQVNSQEFTEPSLLISL